MLQEKKTTDEQDQRLMMKGQVDKMMNADKMIDACFPNWSAISKFFDQLPESYDN